MKYNKIYAVAIISAAALPAMAQLHENISVDGKYVPDIIRVDRVNTFPKALDFTMKSSPLNYESAGVAAGFSPMLLTMPATGWRSTREIPDTKGYLELGAGSWLNSTLSAGYRVVENQNTIVGVRLQHNSTSLWKPKLSEATADVKQYRYDEAIGVYGSHIFDGIGRLDAAIDYHLGLFDYYAFFNPNARPDDILEAPGQTLNDFSLKVDWHSVETPSSSLVWNASARARHYGFRSLPLPANSTLGHAKGTRETDIELAAGIRMPWDSGSSIGLDAALRVLAYGGQSPLYTMTQPGNSDFTLSKPDNYGMLTLTPYYAFTKGLLDVHIGADVNLAFNAGPDGNRYSFFHIAPDVRFALQTGQVGFYLNLLGGTTLNTLASLRQEDYYMMPALTTTRPTYTPLDATLGINFGPFSGFSIGVEGSFRSSKNVPLGGWYQAWMNYGNSPIEGLYNINGSSSASDILYSLDQQGINLHGVSAAAVISYRPSDAFSFTAKGTVQQQDGKSGYFNGYDRPKITGEAEIAFRPVQKLRIAAGVDYRGKRCIYTQGIAGFSGGTVTDAEKDDYLYGYDLPDITLVNLSATYDVTKSFSVWLQGDNLLNKREEALPLLPMQGLSVIAGLKVVF